MTLKKYLVGLGLLGFIFQPALSYASPDLFLLNLYRIERCALMATDENVPIDQIDTCEELYYETIDQAQTVTDKLTDEELAQLNEQWEMLQVTFDSVIQDPSLMSDFYTRDEVHLSREEIATIITPYIEVAEGPMALAQQLEIIAREYLQRANAIFGGGIGTDTNIDIADLVSVADQRFETLEAKYPDSLSLQSAKRRYTFIRSRLIDYNVDMIPYLVDTYTNQIVQSLLELSEETTAPATPPPATES